MAYDSVDIMGDLFTGGVVVGLQLIVGGEEEIGGDYPTNSLQEFENLLVKDLREVKVIIDASIEILRRRDHFGELVN